MAPRNLHSVSPALLITSVIPSIGVRALVLALLLAAAAVPGAYALNRGPYTMEILVDGRPVPELGFNGRVYIEALKSREYSVRLWNHTGERVAIALSVDGLNSIDAKTGTAREATKWILDPWQSITLDGWQTSTDTARRFFFTTKKDSYGAWLGKTSNLGLITAAVFREKRPVPVPVPWSRFEGRRDGSSTLNENAPAPSPGAADGRRDKGESAEGGREADQPAPAPSLQGALGDSFRAPESRKAEKQVVSDDLAATGIGREVGHFVRRIEFDEEQTPAAVLELRYEYRDALVRLGVVPRCPDPSDRLSRREVARGFEDTAFAPDPYRRDCRRH